MGKEVGVDQRLSVVIASFNSAPWLPSTLESLATALSESSWEAEVIVVDDGSTDTTPEVLREIAGGFPVPLQIIAQKNEGRFLARWAGAQAAKYPHLLILDSRVVVGKDSLRYLQDSITLHREFAVWNGHIDIDPHAPLVGHFWQVPTHVFWSEYLANPRPLTITPENFDRVPKGTGFLFLPTQLFRDACLEAWPKENSHLVSDDTKILRFVADQTPIRIDPGFSATYRPRLVISQFLAHGRDRGTLFVDSYAGTSMLRNVLLILITVLPPLIVILLVILGFVGAWPAFWLLTAFGILTLLAPAAIAGLRRCPPKAIWSYLVFIIPFGVVFWSGLVRGLKVHGNAFALHSGQKDQVQG